MQLLVIQFTVKMFHIGFVQSLVLQSLKSQYFKDFIIPGFQRLYYGNLHKTYVKYLNCKLYYKTSAFEILV